MDLAPWREVDGGSWTRENSKAVIHFAAQAEGTVPVGYPHTASCKSDVGLPLSPHPSPGITAKPLTCSNEGQCLSVVHSLGPAFFCSLPSHDMALTMSCSKCENSPTDVSTACGQFCAPLTGMCLHPSPSPEGMSLHLSPFKQFSHNAILSAGRGGCVILF